MIIAMLLIILLSIISFRQDVLSGMSNSYYAAKVKAASDKITQGAGLVYRQGEGARTVIFVAIPEEIQTITLTGNIMLMTVNISGKTDTIYRKTDFTLNGSVPTGIGNYCLLLESYRGYVEVSNFNGSC